MSVIVGLGAVDVEDVVGCAVVVFTGLVKVGDALLVLLLACVVADSDDVGGCVEVAFALVPMGDVELPAVDAGCAVVLLTVELAGELVDEEGGEIVVFTGWVGVDAGVVVFTGDTEEEV